ncbi:hypothetical protein [Leifsonia aquatica]|uniref:hypothetical protein n=1 Tax=Leifsonia aquatica TaxID=144185 RepID=UPI0004689BA7|nr:hypothetical protein [Leifsonia aquatica]
MTTTATELLDHIRSAANGLLENDNDETWGGFTCGELDPLLDLLRFAGMEGEAAAIEQMHAAGDDDPCDRHHGLYLAITQQGWGWYGVGDFEERPELLAEMRKIIDDWDPDADQTTDPEPWLYTAPNYPEGHRLHGRRVPTPTTHVGPRYHAPEWKPRTEDELRAEGVLA